jgi:hypothetical protein
MDNISTKNMNLSMNNGIFQTQVPNLNPLVMKPYGKTLSNRILSTPTN